MVAYRVLVFWEKALETVRNNIAVDRSSCIMHIIFYLYDSTFTTKKKSTEFQLINYFGVAMSIFHL